MQIFEYPYVIITVLVICFIVMGGFGLIFMIKCTRNANGEEEKGFSGIGTLENKYEKLTKSRNQRCLIYIYISLDNLKRIYSESRASRVNSQVRDSLLKAFAVNIEGYICAYDDESYVAVNELTSEKAEEYIEECIDEINKLLVSNEAVNTAEINFGYYSTASTQVAFKTALLRAKQACTMAETKGVSHVEWNTLNGKEFEKKIKIENSIENEIDNNRFFLEYQPILNAKTNKIFGAEVLSRLNSEKDGILTPHAFLSAVNNVGLTEKFDYYIFEKNCKWISNDKENREKYVYTTNFSRGTMCEEGFSDKVIEIAEKYNLNFSSIAIEILEEKNLTPDEKTIMMKNLSILKEKGIIILLDDFGKGYTSFTDLVNFDIDIVKIDREIVKNSVNKSGYVILKNILQTANELGFKTLCEGVETEEQLNIVTEAGCDLIQGFYYHRPMPVTKLERLFDEEK